MQERHDAIYCIVDYHALTSTHDGELIRRNAYEMALGLLALGLDPEKAILFRQSDRPEHLELTWLLAAVTPVSWVERTPSFKEKRRNQPEDVNHALLTYPILQAADIAIYHAKYVPVGKDQAAHLELAREIVRAWNARYGDYFVEPQAGLQRGAHREGDRRRQQDVEVARQRDRDLRRTGRRAEAGHEHGDRHEADPADRPGRPEICNVCQMHRFFGDDYESIWEGERTARTGCVDTKRLLAERMIEFFAEARERRRELSAKPGYVEEIIRAGAERLRPLAEETIRVCHERMGLGPA